MQIEPFDLNKKKEKALNAKKNIYVHGFPEQFNEEDLNKLFSKAGKVTSVFLAKDSNGKSLKHGIITFETLDDASKAKD